MKKLMFVDIHGTLLYYPKDVQHRGDTVAIFPELPAFIEKLAAKRKEGFQVIAITNSKLTSEQIRTELALAGYNPEFFSGFYSCPRPAGKEKPALLKKFFHVSNMSPAVFQKFFLDAHFQAIAKATKILEIAQKEGVSKRNIILVGDTPLTDLVAARMAGVQHGWANPRKKLKYEKAGYKEHPSFRAPRIKDGKSRKRHDWTNQKAIKRFLRP